MTNAMSEYYNQLRSMNLNLYYINKCTFKILILFSTSTKSDS